MKLRNKKTGKIMAIDNIIIQREFSNPEPDERYSTLAELNEEWEDYTPKEPRIDDVVLRILIHDWAYINKIKEVLYVRHSCSCYLFNEDNRIMIEFVGSIRTLEDGKTYTIPELCGEEEDA